MRGAGLVCVRSRGLIDPYFFPSPHPRFHDSVRPGVRHAREASGRTRTSVGNSSRTQTVMSIRYQGIELIVDVCAHFQQFPPVQSVHAPMPGEVMPVVCARPVVHVMVRAFERVYGTQRTLFVFIPDGLPLSGVAKTLHLKPTRRGKIRLMESTVSLLLQPQQERSLTSPCSPNRPHKS